ncbi:MAG: acetylxylan esterase [Planctomycetes bacterium]|nr:acetylxylan esterase [Planctomycetota bacterium]
MKNATLNFVFGPLLFSLQALAQDFPDASQLPPRPELPDPLAMRGGEPIKTKEDWLARRRPELKALFQHYMYGYLPPPPEKIEFALEREDGNYFGGKAAKKEVAISFGPPAMPKIHLLLVIPNAGKKPAPVFLGLNFCGNHAVVNDPSVPPPAGWIYSSCAGVKDNRAAEGGRGSEVDTWAIEQSIDRGYAVATFYNGDIDPDQPDFTDGLHPHFFKPGQTKPGPHDGGTIAAWAWGLHRAVDYLHRDPDIDTERIAVVGHSRNGKTALLAAALDERIALAIPHQAGCGGTAPSRGKIGESVKQINDRFPHWFCGEFKKFNDEPQRLPFDQHCLIALVAPRPVLLSNAVEDTWANPEGQFEMLEAAEPVYRLLGAGGLDAKARPELGKLSGGKLGYYIRAGKHSMTRDDWKVFLDFAGRQLGKRQ